VILDYIHDKGEHLTAEDVIKYVHAKYPGINKSTIYRTLELLEKNGCVFTNKSNELTVYHHAEGDQRYHLVCCRCGKTVDCDGAVFTTAEKALQEQYGFRIDSRHIVISGVCENCRNLKD
jgi:Fur family ferric uptake transcriptional regulator